MTDRSMECPVCGAKPGQRCGTATSMSLPWGQNHEARDREIAKKKESENAE